MNASQATNFTFKILRYSNISNLVKGLNNQGKTNTKDSMTITDKIRLIYDSGASLEFVQVDDDNFYNNLVLIDSKLPEIIAEMIKSYYLKEAIYVSDLVEKMRDKNPNKYNQNNGHQFYQYKIKRLLVDGALGMILSKVWRGEYDATGGYLIIKKDGEIICYHIYSKNQFEDYLFFNTKFDTPSTSRHKFGTIYEEDGNFYIKLNFQIKFK